MLSTRLAFLFFVFTALANVVIATERIAVKRDDNLPARVPYVFPPPGTDAVADAIRQRRVNGTLLDLDGVLLQDEGVASSWNDFFGVIRDNNSLPATMRELFILRTGVQMRPTIKHESYGAWVLWDRV